MHPDNSIQALFVYGTLKRQQLRGGMWPRPPLAVEPALVCGELYDLGAYPGLKAGNDWVLGELWTLQPEDMAITLQVLDAIEGYDAATDSGLYLRIEIPVHRMARPVDAPATELAYTYIIAELAAVGPVRRIDPQTTPSGQRIAQWPDALARVPTQLEDE